GAGDSASAVQAAAGRDGRRPYPASGAVAAALLARRGDAGACVLHEVRTRPWEAERAAACSELGPEQWPRVWAETGGLLWGQVQALVTRVRGAIGDLASDGPEPSERAEAAASALRGATLDAVLGQHDAPWLALFDALGRLEGPLAGLAEA